MALNWIVVAHRTGARILSTPTREHDELTEHAAFSNEAGRLRNRDLDEDREGSARFGVSSGAYEQHEDAHRRQAKAFAGKIADYLEGARTAREFDGLVLVAEPKFLGMLIAALSPQTASRVRKTITKNLHHVETPEIDSHLRGEWREARGVS